MTYILQAQNVNFNYRDGDRVKSILSDCSINFKAGLFYAIIGESGCGKTTFLSLLGGLEKPNKGKILFAGKDIATFDKGEYLRKHVSFIFQEYNLLSYLTALENVLLAMRIHQLKINNEKQKAMAALQLVGIDESKMKRRVATLSGGERQRVAIARAIVCNSEIILADEPTGNLDEATTGNIVDLFVRLAHEFKRSVIVVTHSQQVALKADIVVELDGRNKKFRLAS